MEFLDILHGRISITNEDVKPFLNELLHTPELQRLRNMRQMNFDVPLIQELGKSRRFPHTIGVMSIALNLAHKNVLDGYNTKVLLAAALLHDAAIPPYGHLLESEFKQVDPNFSHEYILENYILGNATEATIYQEVNDGGYLSVKNVLDKYEIDVRDVLKLVYPDPGSHSPISAEVDIDNIDNVHRMAVMLGWSEAKENALALLQHANLNGLDELSFSIDAEPFLEKWLDYRQRIYTMIIAHPECIPYNALQADLARIAVEEQIITPSEWLLTEPVFEQRLFQAPSTQILSKQLLNGCKYSLLDYVWIKDFSTSEKLINSTIVNAMKEKVKVLLGRKALAKNDGSGIATTDEEETGYFVWIEKGLISRELNWLELNGNRVRTGENSRSCIIALVKKTIGGGSWKKSDSQKWRSDAIAVFSELSKTEEFEVEYPENYTGSYRGFGAGNLQIKFH